MEQKDPILLAYIVQPWDIYVYFPIELLCTTQFLQIVMQSSSFNVSFLLKCFSVTLSSIIILEPYAAFRNGILLLVADRFVGYR